MTRVRQGEIQELPAQDRLQPKLVTPLENSDDHPLMQKYAKISQTALKNPPADLDAEAANDPPTPIG